MRAAPNYAGSGPVAEAPTTAIKDPHAERSNRSPNQDADRWADGHDRRGGGGCAGAARKKPAL